MDLKIVPYSPEYKKIWDSFVKESKNGTFLFYRQYMDYHADRFTDNSLMFINKDKLYCLLPASLEGNVLSSHPGLTYGGLIMSKYCTAEGILEVFEILLGYLGAKGIEKLLYKPVPHIYHKLPAEEDLYAIFRHNGKLIGRNISSTVSLIRSLPLKRDRKTALNRALRSDIQIRESHDYESFWKILVDNLENKYGAVPVHTLDEIKMLSCLFPENIKLWSAFSGEKMLAGLVGYYTDTTVHAQYISATEEGKKAGCVDLLITWLKDYNIPKINPEKLWFDLGTSNGNNGLYLNENLIYQKQGFGARGIVYDTYEITIYKI